MKKQKNEHIKMQRTCLGCSNKTNKSELIRIVAYGEKLVIDKNNNLQNSRRAYVCKNKECVKKLKKNRRLNKSFKRQVNDKIYEMLDEFIEEINRNNK